MRRSPVIALALSLLAGAAGCGAPSSAAEAPPSRKSALPAGRVASPEEKPLPASIGSADPPSAAPPAPANTPETPLPFTIERVREGRVLALAVDKPPHVAALGDEAVWVRTSKGWREERLPRHRHFETADRSSKLFYGRDFRVRLVVNVANDGAAEHSYWRWLPGGFRSGREELGPLAKLLPPDDRLVCVLGNDDPEVVCRPRDVCVIKRVSGWSTFRAPEHVSLAAIGAGKGYLIEGQRLLEIVGDKSVRALGSDGPWKVADALLVQGESIWVVETEVDRLHRFDGKSWHSEVSPVSRPAVVWGASSAALFVGGAGGLAFGDGNSWRVVPNVEGPVRDVLGHGSSEVWFAGDRGLYRGVFTN